MNDTESSAPTVYLDLGGFDPHTSPVRGCVREWEGENVFHLSVVPPEHGYGIEGECLFTSSSAAKPPIAPDGKNSFAVLVDGNGARVFQAVGEDWREVDAETIPERDGLYSRGRGLLETDALARKRVLIVGLGSFGSQIAVELAKAGVGHFSLMDFDRVEPHNLMRHVCGTRDLGRLKTDAVRDAILGKNPYAEVDRHPVDALQALDLLEEEVARADLTICATDNNQSRFAISGALLRQERTGIFGRAVTRAAGGDVFRYHPGGPCYCCLIGNGWFDRHSEEITDERSARRDGRIPAYMSATDAAAVVQVGLSADIAPICNLMEKLALVELSRGTESGIGELDFELPYDYYMWANRRERTYEAWAPFNGAGAKPTILRWYGVRVPRDPECAFCGEDIVLDEGDDIEDSIETLERVM